MNYVNPNDHWKCQEDLYHHFLWCCFLVSGYHNYVEISYWHYFHCMSSRSSTKTHSSGTAKNQVTTSSHADGDKTSATFDLADGSKQEAQSVIMSQCTSGLRRQPSVRSQSIAATESELQDYHSELCHHYVLHMLWEEDLQNSSFSYIDHQVYHPNCPMVVQVICPVEWAELPAPFQHNKPGNPGPNLPPGGDSHDNNGDDSHNHRDLPPHFNSNNGNGNLGGTGGLPDDSSPPGNPDEPSRSSGASDYNSNPENPSAEHPNWTYDPTPQSKEEMLKAAFKPLEDLIVGYLFCKPLRGNMGVQKTLIQSLPKPDYYCGEDDMTLFFEWVCSLVYISDGVATTIPFLKGSALQHYEDVIEPIPDKIDPEEPLQGHGTFIQLIASLY
ncbi:hypothetical protein L218DRAFT_951930 [Marasmius fiardii PR-910]|nr:hypothetical protein L218DRAFT_951930 [Marasmius fiardii PR-910]